MTIDEMIEVLTAAKEGKAIECRPKRLQALGVTSNGENWTRKLSGPCSWNFLVFDYRVKPEPRRFWIVAGPHEVINAYHHEPTGLREVDEAIQVVEVSK